MANNNYLETLTIRIYQEELFDALTTFKESLKSRKKLNESGFKASLNDKYQEILGEGIRWSLFIRT